MQAPKLAATVVVLRRAAALGNEEGRFKLLLVQRHSKARFMANLYVFPGGIEEKEDNLYSDLFTDGVEKEVFFFFFSFLFFFFF